MVLSDPYYGGASIKELEFEGLVKVIAPEVELTADKGARGATVDEGREDLGQAIKSDIDDKQMCRPQVELWRSPELLDHSLGVLEEGQDIKGH
ncbi:hypothetical protein C0989_002324 [Termitomyces sp. Mn162]|nr:hypothetical protein C0989_002324 [Termitomyces sp. Mn162]